jgi:hypothetical protein
MKYYLIGEFIFTEIQYPQILILSQRLQQLQHRLIPQLIILQIQHLQLTIMQIKKRTQILAALQANSVVG